MNEREGSDPGNSMKRHGSSDGSTTMNGERIAESLAAENHQDIEKTDSHAAETSAPSDRYLVNWDGPDDPENPQNLSVLKKWLITFLFSTLTIWVTFSTSVFSPTVFVTAEEFHVSTEVTILATSLNIFVCLLIDEFSSHLFPMLSQIISQGFAIGPLVWGPLSELFGRLKPLFVGYTLFNIFQIPVAVAQNLETLMICRFLSGFFAVSSLAILGGAMADFWGPVDRAIAISLFAGATFIGPIFGPIMYVEVFHQTI